jgi:replicative DNA helicase
MQPGVKSTAPVQPLRPSPGRVPPHNLDAEAAVLSTVLLKPDEYDVVAGIIQVPHFYSDANRRIFEAVAALHEASQPVDTVTVATWLQAHGRLAQVGGPPYLALIMDSVPAVANVTAYAEIVRDAWQKRQLIAQCQTFAAEAYDTPTPARELVQNAEASLAELGSSGSVTAFARVGDVVATEVARMEEAKRLGLTGFGLTTGFHRLDEKTAGLHKGDLTIIAARPGHGKSSLVMNIAAAVARPCTDGVGVFSLEMPKEQIAMRLACAERGIDTALVRRNAMKDEQWAELRQAALDVASMPLWIDDTAGLSLMELRARARKLQRDVAAERMGVPCKRLGLICVDYLQLMRGNRERGDSREQEIGSITRGLKQLAKDLQVPVIALSQLNRDTEKHGKDHRPKLSSLRESGNIEQDADSVWFIYRPDMYDTEVATGNAELIIGKQRNGPLDTIEMQFRGSTMRFYERVGGVDVDQFDDVAEALGAV